MASRSKTLIFVQFRATFARETTTRLSGKAGTRRIPHRRIPGGGTSDEEEATGLIHDHNPDQSHVSVEMSALPPKWVDIVDEVDEDIIKIKAKITELEVMHKKHLLPGFSDDRIGSEQNIERFAEQITS
ncbi:hypothetical protein HK100_006326, partial [Physocladia obscura]